MMNETLPGKRVPYPMTPERPSKASDTGAADGSAEAFEAVFGEHWEHIYRTLVRLVGDPDEAQDLALETFWRFYQRPPAPGAGANLSGWLHRVAVNLGLDALRRWKRRQFYEVAGTIGQDQPQDSPAELFQAAEDRRKVRLALSRLEPRQAQLLLVRLSGLDYRQTAALLNVAPGSVGTLLARAEKAFAACYQAIETEDK